MADTQTTVDDCGKDRCFSVGVGADGKPHGYGPGVGWFVKPGERVMFFDAKTLGWPRLHGVVLSRTRSEDYFIGLPTGEVKCVPFVHMIKPFWETPAAWE